MYNIISVRLRENFTISTNEICTERIFSKNDVEFLIQIHAAVEPKRAQRRAASVRQRAKNKVGYARVLFRDPDDGGVVPLRTRTRS